MSAKLLYEFPNKSLGLSAIEAFSGKVFKALDIASLTRNRIGYIPEQNASA